MERQIYEVYAKIVDANGSYNTLSGYPKSFDSKNYDNDVIKTYHRAEGEFHECVGAMCKNDARQLQSVILMSADGVVRKKWSAGHLAEVEPPVEGEGE